MIAGIDICQFDENMSAKEWYKVSYTVHTMIHDALGVQYYNKGGYKL